MDIEGVDTDWCDNVRHKDEVLKVAMDTCSDMLLRMACLILKDVKLAEDAVQETFINFYYGMDRFRGEAGIKTYLSRILINQCRQKLRKGWFKKVFTVNSMDNAVICGATAAEDTVDRLNVSQGLLKLDVRYREVILLHYYSDLSVKEIAHMLGQSEGTVKSKLKRGRDKLKVLIREDLFDE